MTWFTLFDTNVRKWPGRRAKRPLLEVLAEIMYTAQIAAEILKGFAVGAHVFFISGSAKPYVSVLRPISSVVWPVFDIKYGFPVVRVAGNIYVPVSIRPTVRIIPPFTANVWPTVGITAAIGHKTIPANVFTDYYVRALTKPIYPLVQNVYPYMYINYGFKHRSIGYNAYVMFSLDSKTEIINNTQPYFLVSVINAPKNVQTRSEFTITWLISNYGNVQGTYIFYVGVQNGQTVYEETDTLDPRASKTIVTTHTAPAQSGRINIIACIYKTGASTADDCAEVVIDVS